LTYCPWLTYNWSGFSFFWSTALVEEKASAAIGKEQRRDIEELKRRLGMLDQRLDNIDSIVTAVAERVMSQPIVFNIICPRCGKNIEISLVGKEKPTV
jgi:hypothetical protein